MEGVHGPERDQGQRRPERRPPRPPAEPDHRHARRQRDEGREDHQVAVVEAMRAEPNVDGEHDRWGRQHERAPPAAARQERNAGESGQAQGKAEPVARQAEDHAAAEPEPPEDGRRVADEQLGRGPDLAQPAARLEQQERRAQHECGGRQEARADQEPDGVSRRAAPAADDRHERRGEHHHPEELGRRGESRQGARRQDRRRAPAPEGERRRRHRRDDEEGLRDVAHLVVGVHNRHRAQRQEGGGEKPHAPAEEPPPQARRGAPRSPSPGPR